ncbi:hypothetical protein HQ584_02715 [Patescibacteria group bacterium]|nr:hypothetical protein [Patescibacteria group bacterium]
MKIKLNGKLWGEFLSEVEIRMQSLEIANERFLEWREKAFAKSSDKIDTKTVLFVKGYGNNPELLSCLRELMFNSRELLDYLLMALNIKTKPYPVQTSRNFLPFAQALVKNKYDSNGLDMISFLKTNITYIFHIRKFRNEIKIKPSNLKFRLVTNHLEAYFRVPIKNDESILIDFLDIRNKKQAIDREGYHCTLNLDEYFPEMIEFWKHALKLYLKGDA